MSRAFVFKSTDVLWFETLPTRPEGKTATGRMAMFVETLRQHPGQWGQYPHVYKAGAQGALYGIRKTYPNATWEARGNTLWGKFGG